MGTATQAQDQQLAAAAAEYQQLKEKEDVLYHIYLRLPLTAHPLELDAARMAYLEASTLTLRALCKVAHLQMPRQRGIGFSSEA